MKSTKINRIEFMCSHCHNLVMVDIPETEVGSDDYYDIIADSAPEACAVCGCTDAYHHVDEGIADIVCDLNRKGYFTRHTNDVILNSNSHISKPHIQFAENMKIEYLDNLPASWKIYSEPIERRRSTCGIAVKASPEDPEEFVTKIAPDAIRDLREWVKNLPECPSLFEHNGCRLIGFNKVSAFFEDEHTYAFCIINERLYAFYPDLDSFFAGKPLQTDVCKVTYSEFGDCELDPVPRDSDLEAAMLYGKVDDFCIAYLKHIIK